MSKFVRDTWLVFGRAMTLTIRNPVWIIVGLMQPIYYLVLFGPLLENVSGPGMPTGGGAAAAFRFFVPGLLVQLALFGTLFVGFGLIAELRAGVLERMRVTPVSRLALLLGRAGRDVVTLLVQALMLTVLSLPLGLELQLVPFLLTLSLLTVLALLGASVSYATALILKSEDALAPLANAVTMPILLLSGVFLPMTFAPDWLQSLSELNPLKHGVDAARALFAGNTGDSSVLLALVLLGTLCTVAVVWAARRFARAVS